MCLAIPARVTELAADGHFAQIDVSGVRRKINIDLLADEGVSIGDWVLIHVGFAMSKISATDAQEQLALLEALGEGDAAREEIAGYGRVAEKVS